MNKRNFGKVIKSLRQEQFDFTSGHTWTQAQLAQAANLSTATIGKIEQGRRVNLSGADLLQLADALQLSTLERREFFAAATEVEQSQIATDRASAQSMFQHVWHIFRDVQLPAYIIDPFADLVGVNATLMRFYGVTLDTLHAARDSAIGCNVLNLVFRPTTFLYVSMGER